MAAPLTIFEYAGSFYCAECFTEEEGKDVTVVAQDEYHSGAYCCNCGRHSDGNEDAHRPGYAVDGDFCFTDLQKGSK